MTLGEYDLVSGLIRFYFSLQLQKRMLSKQEAEGGGGREKRESRVGVAEAGGAGCARAQRKMKMYACSHIQRGSYRMLRGRHGGGRSKALRKGIGSGKNNQMIIINEINVASMRSSGTTAHRYSESKIKTSRFPRTAGVNELMLCTQFWAFSGV